MGLDFGKPPAIFRDDKGAWVNRFGVEAPAEVIQARLDHLACPAFADNGPLKDYYRNRMFLPAPEGINWGDEDLGLVCYDNAAEKPGLCLSRNEFGKQGGHDQFLNPDEKLKTIVAPNALNLLFSAPAAPSTFLNTPNVVIPMNPTIDPAFVGTMPLQGMPVVAPAADPNFVGPMPYQGTAAIADPISAPNYLVAPMEPL